MTTPQPTVAVPRAYVRSLLARHDATLTAPVRTVPDAADVSKSDLWDRR